MARGLGNPNRQGPFGNTLLHSAVVSGDIREVRRLLAAGASSRIVNRDGRLPAHPLDEHVERLLDQALEATFPASDPIAVSPPAQSR
jgi:hypothetical protein